MSLASRIKLDTERKKLKVIYKSRLIDNRNKSKS